MKFVQRDMGDAAEASSGGGGRGILKEVLTLILIFVVVMGALHLIINWAADFAVRRISIEREMALFSSKWDLIPQWTPSEVLEPKAQIARDALSRLLQAPSAPAVDLRLIFVEQEDPNAIAYVGGTIAVTKGLLEAIEEEAEIAFILSHEIGHFVHRDHLRSMSRQLGTRLTLGILFGHAEVSDFINRTDQIIHLAYSRQQESAADAYALQLAKEAYGESEAYQRVMRKLHESETLPDWAQMFSTHPGKEERLKRIQEFLEPTSGSRNEVDTP